MSDTIVVVEDGSESTEQPPTEVHVEVSENHDVEFAERLTRLETSIVDCVRREELTYIHDRLSAVEATAIVAAEVAVEAAEIAETAVTEPVVTEPVTEVVPESKQVDTEEKPKSKKSKWWGF